MLNAIWLFILGVLGASNIIIAKKPDAKELIAKLAPYQGWIGAVSALWGVWVVISSVLGIGLLSKWPLAWITWLAVGVILFSLGLLLGVGVLKTFIKQPQAVEKMDALIAKLSPYQGKLGLFSIALAVWSLLYSFVLQSIIKL